MRVGCLVNLAARSRVTLSGSEMVRCALLALLALTCGSFRAAATPSTTTRALLLFLIFFAQLSSFL
jgi:hypothetical protein